MGEVFAGRYELVDPIGRGGVGAVWRAWDHRRRRYVAAKVLQQSDAHALLRFVREQALRIDHPHVLAPASWAADDDKVLFTMDLVAGGSLVHLVGDYGPLPPAYVCTLLDQLLSGLAAVHAEGVVHRDIKPANILLEATGTARPRLRLSDFGIAMRLGEPRLTETDYVVGTPGYLAPEQMLGAEPDFPADLFAVGLVALYLLEGAKPDARALVEHFASHGTPGAPQGVPEPLWQVVAALLQPDPRARFRTATGARKALASAVELLAPPGVDDEQIEIFDQLGPLPPGFAPEGPLRGEDETVPGRRARDGGTAQAAVRPAIAPSSPGTPSPPSAPPAPPASAPYPPMPTSEPHTPSSQTPAPHTPVPMPVSGPHTPAPRAPMPTASEPHTPSSHTPVPASAPPAAAPPAPMRASGPHAPPPPSSPPAQGVPWSGPRAPGAGAAGAPSSADAGGPSSRSGPGGAGGTAGTGVPPRPGTAPAPPPPATMSDTGSFHLPPPQPSGSSAGAPSAAGPSPAAHSSRPGSPAHRPPYAPAPQARTEPGAAGPPSALPAPLRGAVSTATTEARRLSAHGSTASYTALERRSAPVRQPVPQPAARHRAGRAVRRRPGPPAKVAVPVLLLALVCYAVGFWALTRI